MAVHEGQSLILEEPETNLHPNYQSKLADLIVDGFKTNHNQFIIETHSEYLVRKFQYLVATGNVDCEAIQIYYFSDHENVKPEEIKIRKDGTLKGDFGNGFFDHAPYLITDLWKAQRYKN